MQICRVFNKNIMQALDLVWRVFERCDLEDYEEVGVQTFRYFIRRENIESMMDAGEIVFFGAYESSRLIGVIAMRGGFHISLLFVDEQYQRQGVAKKLVRRAVAYCLEQSESLSHITVNASPKGVPAYLAMGFYPLSTEQKKDGIRFTPMRIDLKG